MIEIILAVSINTTMLPPCAQPQYIVKPDVVGKASSPDTGETFYYAEYYYDYCAGNDLVLYKNPNKELFTWKIISDSEIKTAPKIEQFDTQHGEHIKTNWENGNIVLQYKKNGDTDFINAELTPSEDQIIDAGFDQYVQENWSNLVDFEVQDFSYASPPHQANFTMRIKRMDENQCKQIIKNIDQHVCFKAEANNFLFRVFSKPIKLVYDNDRRLKKFYGITNVLNPNGKNYFAEITYQYQD